MKEYKLFLSIDRSNAEDYLNLSAKEGYTLHSIIPVGERSMLIAMEREIKTSSDTSKEEEFKNLIRR
jgi:hypothetical protein